jgi:putative tricarboxylic transport membrane protein
MNYFIEIFYNLIQGFSEISNFLTIALIILGTAIGILVGAMPGLAPSIGVALVLPFSFYLEPINGLALLVSVYLSANYGGSITAITINTPGTAGSLATTFDGYPLTKKGEPGLALGTSIFASTIGGMIGCIVLIIFAQPLAKIALSFGPHEYFAIGILGLTIISSLSSKQPIKGFIASLLGLLIITIGFDTQLNFSRFSLGIKELNDGIKLIPPLIGLFALGEIFYNIEESSKDVNASQKFSSKMPSFLQLWKLKIVILKSSLIGSVIGAIPGAGSAIASLIAYNEAKRSSKKPEEYGQGSLEGIAAPESSNNASVGGALIPLMTLGIPGSASTAVLLGALMIHNIQPGPELFKPLPHGNPSLIYGIFLSLLIANFFMYIMGMLGNRLWIKIISAPKSIVYSCIITLSFIGSYFLQNSFFDVFLCLVFGIVSWIFKRNNFPVSPIILGIILGKMIETNLRLALVQGDLLFFLQKPIATIVLIFAVLAFTYPLIKKTKQKV